MYNHSTKIFPAHQPSPAYQVWIICVAVFPLIYSVVLGMEPRTRQTLIKPDLYLQPAFAVGWILCLLFPIMAAKKWGLVVGFRSLGTHL